MAFDSRDQLLQQMIDRAFTAGRRSAGRMCRKLAANMSDSDPSETFASLPAVEAAQITLLALADELAPTSRSGVPLTRNTK